MSQLYPTLLKDWVKGRLLGHRLICRGGGIDGRTVNGQRQTQELLDHRLCVKVTQIA